MIKNADKISREFESFLRNELPSKLKLTASKKVAMERTFYHFSDFLKNNFKKAPVELENFLKEFKKKINNVEKWRAPKGTKVIPLFYNGKEEKYLNGQTRYRLADKK